MDEYSMDNFPMSAPSRVPNFRPAALALKRELDAARAELYRLEESLRLLPPEAALNGRVQSAQQAVQRQRRVIALCVAAVNAMFEATTIGAVGGRQ